MNKKSIEVALVVAIGILMLGIGYAVITNVQMNITGSASASSSNSDFVVGFLTTATPTKTGGVTAASDTNTTTATLSATLNSGSSTGEATFTIKNSSAELGADLSVEVSAKDANTTKYFTVTPTLAASSLAKGATTTVTVKVDLTKIPVNNVTGNFTVTVTATPKES